MESVAERRDEFNAVLLGEDELGIILRAHIYIEHELMEFINAQLAVPSALEDAGLNYASRVQLALALGLESTLKAPLNAFGKLRNAFAHRLGKKIEKNDADNLYKAFDTEGKNVLQRAYEATHTQLDTKSKTKVSELLPKDRCILCLVTLFAAVIAEQPRLEGKQ